MYNVESVTVIKNPLLDPPIEETFAKIDIGRFVRNMKEAKNIELRIITIKIPMGAK